MVAILETKNLTKRFDGVRAVDDLSVGFEKGKITGVIGPNGSGKTTLVNVLTGVVQNDGGDFIVAGIHFKKMKPYEVAFYGITRTFQEVRLFEQMTVLDNILAVLTERNVFSALFEKHTKYHLQKAEEVLEKVGLREKKNQLAANLSYGQRKLLEIARAVAHAEANESEDDIFFFDEPFAGLFPEMVKIISGIMKELRAVGKTIVLIEHNMSLIRELCDNLIVMDTGKLLAEGEPEKILAKREVIEAYLGE